MSRAQDLLDSEALKDAAAELFALLPSTMRGRDAAEGHPLEALVRVLASGSLELTQALDAMADAAFVETADAAALEDLARLVGATPLAPLPPGSGHDTRAYVANTLRHRASKGTARSLEQLASDVGGFGTVVVEYFRRLSRTEHLIDPRADRPGVARIKAGVTAARAGSAFDTLPRLVDLRSIARAAGRHHVPNVGVHVLRPIAPRYPAPGDDVVTAADLAGVPPAAAWTTRNGFFRLAAQPDGTIALFNPDRRAEAEGRPSTPAALPDRLARLPLNLETRERRRAVVAGQAPRLEAMPWFAGDAPFAIFTSTDGQTFRRVPAAEIRIANLTTVPAGRPFDHADGHPVAVVIDPVTGRLAVPKPKAGKPDVREVRVAYATGIALPIGAGPQERNDATVPFELIDAPGLTHFVRIVDATAASAAIDPAPVRTVPTLAAALADWIAARGAWASRPFQRAVFVLNRCDRERTNGAFTLPLMGGVEHHVVAGQWRAYVSRPGSPPDPARLGFIVRRERRSIIEKRLRVTAAAQSADGEAAGTGTLVIDGIELAAGIVIAGDAARSVRIRYATIRAPGTIAVQVSSPLNGATIAIEQSLLGPVAVAGGGEGLLTLRDCIVASDGADVPVVAAEPLDARLDNVTLLGASAFKSIEATNVLFTDVVDVRRTQAGCVRYSYVFGANDPASGTRVPRRFRCLPDLARAAASQRHQRALTDEEAADVDLSVRPLFLDTALDQPTCGMLHPLAADLLRMGGEHDAEIGAFARAAEGLRMANIRRLFAEALPFGLEAGLIDDTRSSATAARRNVP